MGCCAVDRVGRALVDAAVAGGFSVVGCAAARAGVADGAGGEGVGRHCCSCLLVDLLVGLNVVVSVGRGEVVREQIRAGFRALQALCCLAWNVHELARPLGRW